MKEKELLNLVLLHYFNSKDKLVKISVQDIAGKTKTVKYNEIAFIIFITIFLLLFFTKTIEVFLFLLTFEFTIGVLLLGLVRNKWTNAIMFFLLKSLRGCKFGWR